MNNEILKQLADLNERASHALQALMVEHFEAIEELGDAGRRDRARAAQGILDHAHRVVGQSASDGHDVSEEAVSVYAESISEFADLPRSKRPRGIVEISEAFAALMIIVLEPSPDSSITEPQKMLTPGESQGS